MYSSAWSRLIPALVISARKNKSTDRKSASLGSILAESKNSWSRKLGSVLAVDSVIFCSAATAISSKVLSLNVLPSLVRGLPTLKKVCPLYCS